MRVFWRTPRVKRRAEARLLAADKRAMPDVEPRILPAVRRARRLAIRRAIRPAIADRPATRSFSCGCDREGGPRLRGFGVKVIAVADSQSLSESEVLLWRHCAPDHVAGEFNAGNGIGQADEPFGRWFKGRVRDTEYMGVK